MADVKTPAFFVLSVMMQLENKNSLSAWLNWLEACHPSEIELGLDRIRSVAEKLSLNLGASTVVTIAGTNGKGSTIQYLQSIYCQAGYSVGSFTSPHFLEYNERVQLNGQNVSDQCLCDAFARIDQARGEIPLTYFEFGTLAALVIFSDETPDLVLLEVGLGGRLDAVNIVDADISVVTTVALDHMDWLGDNREDIGFEKAGIFREGKPSVCGDLDPPASVTSYAQKIGARLFQSGEVFAFKPSDSYWDWEGVSNIGEAIKISQIPMPELPLQNASTVLQVLQFIPLNVSETQVKAGIESARLTGRMQQIKAEETVYYLDVAHNPEAAKHLRDRVDRLPGRSWLVLGMLADKDCNAVIQIFEPLFEKIYLVSLDVPRGQTAEQLQGCFSSEVNLTLNKSVTAAIDEIKSANNRPESVIIAGSFFTVAEALSVLEVEPV
ncbi:MAG: bifunctional tetrahydrofolate synthase/dihydrofolate synthase [Neptuniibacter sp.]